MRRVIPIVLALFLIVSIRTSAQQPEPVKFPEGQWYNVVSWQFATMRVDTALSLIFDHFMPAGDAAGMAGGCHRHITGEWHATCLFVLEEGPADLEWQTSPQDAEFMAKLFELEGEAAMEMFQTMGAAVVRTTSYIAFEPSGGM